MTTDRRHQSQAIPDEVSDMVTGVVDDPDARAAARGKRPTDQRVARLEVRADGIEDKLDRITTWQLDFAKEVGEVVGELRHLPKAIENFEKALERIAADQAAQRLDVRERVQFHRDVKLRIIGGAITLFSTGAGALWVLQKLGVL